MTHLVVGFIVETEKRIVEVEKQLREMAESESLSCYSKKKLELRGLGDLLAQLQEINGEFVKRYYC